MFLAIMIVRIAMAPPIKIVYLVTLQTTHILELVIGMVQDFVEEIVIQTNFIIQILILV